jgi:hypothetical protein
LPISAKVDLSGSAKRKSGGQMGAQNSILRSQIFVLEEQLLIDHAGHVGEQAYPFVFIHLEPPSYPASSIRSDFLPLRGSVGKAGVPVETDPDWGGFAATGPGRVRRAFSYGEKSPGQRERFAVSV